MNEFRETGWANNIAHSNKQNYCKQVNIKPHKTNFDEEIPWQNWRMPKTFEIFFCYKFSVQNHCGVLDLWNKEEKNTNINKKRIWIFYFIYISKIRKNAGTTASSSDLNTPLVSLRTMVSIQVGSLFDQWACASRE